MFSKNTDSFYQHFISECPAMQMKHKTSWNYHFKCIITIGLTNPILLSEYALRKHFLEMRKCKSPLKHQCCKKSLVDGFKHPYYAEYLNNLPA